MLSSLLLFLVVLTIPVELHGTQGLNAAGTAVELPEGCGGILKLPEAAEKVEEEPDVFHVEESDDDVEEELDELLEEPEGQPVVNSYSRPLTPPLTPPEHSR